MADNRKKLKKSCSPEAVEPSRSLKLVPKGRLGTELANMAPHLRMSFLKSKGFFGGKQGSVFKVRLPIAPTSWSSNGSGIIAQTFGVAANALAGVADWETVFAEYRIVRGVFLVHPVVLLTPGAITNLPAMALGVNYESSLSTPTTLAQVVQFDSSRVMTWIHTKPIAIPFDLNKVFGEIWTNVGTYSTFAGLIGYGATYPVNSAIAAWISGHFDMEYRGLA